MDLKDLRGYNEMPQNSAISVTDWQDCAKDIVGLVERNFIESATAEVALVLTYEFLLT
jgi:hypothetical protein